MTPKNNLMSIETLEKRPGWGGPGPRDGFIHNPITEEQREHGLRYLRMHENKNRNTFQVGDYVYIRGRPWLDKKTGLFKLGWVGEWPARKDKYLERRIIDERRAAFKYQRRHRKLDTGVIHVIHWSEAPHDGENSRYRVRRDYKKNRPTLFRITTDRGIQGWCLSNGDYFPFYVLELYFRPLDGEEMAKMHADDEGN